MSIFDKEYWDEMSSSFTLQNAEDFLGNAGTAIEDSTLGETWDSVKGAASSAWNSPLNVGNQLATEHVVAPALGAIAPIIDAPMNALQGSFVDGSEGAWRGLTQQEDYNYGQALPQDVQDNYPNVTGAVRNVGEIVGDPLNLVTGGSLKLAQKSLKHLSDAKILPESLKGMYTSLPANYIDNFYGDGAPNAPLSPVEQTMYDEFDNLSYEKFNTLNHAEKRALAKRISGFSTWAVDSLKAAGKTLLDPEAKALFAELGINKNTQKILREQLIEADAQSLASQTSGGMRKRPDQTKAFQKAVAQTLFQKSVPLQAGRVGRTHKSIDNVVDSATLGGVGPSSKGRYIEHVLEGQKSTKSIDGGKSRNFQHNPDDLGFAYDAINNIWKKDMSGAGSTRLVVKKSQGTGGDHATDAIKDNPARNTVKAMFGSLKSSKVSPTIDSMYETLTKITNKKGNKTNVYNPSLEHARKHGLWIHSSRSGKGIKEGGVNVLTKINPDMTTMTVVSDMHNFLEKGPTKPLMRRLLPNDELTMTPPIYTDLRDKGTKGRRAYSNKTSDTDGNRAAMEDIQALVDAKASPEVIQAFKDERTRKILNGMFLTSTAGQASKYNNR